MCAMRLVSKKENPVSALLASESRERAKKFIDIRVLSTEGIEDEIDVLRKLAKDYYEVCDENVKLKKNIYDINNELNKLNSIREKEVELFGDDCPLTMKERLGVVMVVVLVTIFLSFITVDWSVIF